MDYDYIDSNRKLAAYLDTLKKNNVTSIALDIEGESNLHHFGEELCLIQVYDGTRAVIIDPYKTSLKESRQIIEDRSILKIMYDAPSDRAFLYKNYEVEVLSILDLRAAVTLLDYEKMDLGSILKEVLKVESSTSKKRFQRYNWTTRPISDEALEYALKDVIYLFDLKDSLMEIIVEKGLLDAFTLRNVQAQNKPHIYDKRPGVMRTGRFKKLQKAEQKRFENLVRIRENHARNLNFPPHAVLSNEFLFAIATGKKTIQGADIGKKVPGKVRAKLLDEVQKAV